LTVNGASQPMLVGASVMAWIARRMAAGSKTFFQLSRRISLRPRSTAFPPATEEGDSYWALPAR